MPRLTPFLLVIASTAFAASESQTGWVEGEIGLRLHSIGAVAAAGPVLRPGDVLTESRTAAYLFDEQSGEYESAAVGVEEGALFGAGGETGFLVTRVALDSLAARVELRPGDFIARIDHKPVRSLADLAAVPRACDARVPVRISLIRWDAQQRGFVRAESQWTFSAPPL